jgi:DHA1 family solute carrier family 18 vesicular amine transporter 1/2
MGIWTAGNATGTLLGPVLGGFLYQSFGHWGPLAVAGGVALLDGAGRALLITSVQANVRPPAFQKLARHPALLDVCAIAILGAAGLTLLEATLPLHVQTVFAATPMTIGAFFAVATLAFGVTSPVVGMIERRMGRLRAALGGLCLLALSLPLVALAPTLWAVFVAVAIVGAAVGLTITPAMPALAELVDQLGGATYGVAYSLFNTAFAIGMAAGPLLGSSLVTTFGLPLGLSAVSAVMLGCVFGLRSRVISRESPGSPERSV